MKDGQYPVGQITAVDVATGNTVWQYQQRAYNYSAVLATAGGLVFNGDGARYFFALDTETRQEDLGRASGLDVLWLPGHLPVNGRQYIAVVAGYGRNSLAPEIDAVDGANMIYVFALPESRERRCPVRRQNTNRTPKSTRRGRTSQRGAFPLGPGSDTFSIHLMPLPNVIDIWTAC